METIHGGLRIARDADVKTYAPPGRLRRYDVIIIDEASQVEDRVAKLAGGLAAITAPLGPLAKPKRWYRSMTMSAWLPLK